MKKMLGKMKSRKGQNIIEYCVLFVVVVGVIVFATSGVIGPALNGLYDRTAESLAQINTQVP